MGVFYGNFFYITPKIVEGKRTALFVSIMVVAVLAVSLVNFVLHELMTGHFPDHRSFPPPDRNPMGPGFPGPGGCGETTDPIDASQSVVLQYSHHGAGDRRQ